MVYSMETDPPVRLLAAFHQTYPDHIPDRTLPVPGRDLWIMAGVNDSRQFDITALDVENRATFTYQTAKTMQTARHRPLPLWARYPAGVVVTLANMGFDPTGLVAVVAGDERPGARYDYALGLAFAALYCDLYDQPCADDHLIRLVERVRRTLIQ